MRIPTIASLAFALGLGILPLGTAGATHTQTFHATLVGSEEVPANLSTARGTATVALNDDLTLTYAVTSTGFSTRFRNGHVHPGAAGVVGPILFFLECNEEGTSCTGSSPTLTAADVEMIAAGDAYVNLHTDAFPGGEIRGQLRSLALEPPSASATVLKFTGRASGVQGGKGADVRMKGHFFVGAPVDLRWSTAAIAVLLGETGGAGELIRNGLHNPTLPVPLFHLRPNEREKEAVYQSARGGGDPRCRLKLKIKDAGLFEFELECKRSEGVTIPFPPTLCTAGPLQTTNLRTWLVLNLGTTVGVDVTRPWRCLGRNSNVRELKAVELKNSSGGGGGSGEDNRPPKADFRALPRSGDAPLTVHFENRSQDPDGDALSFEWHFGDGTSSSERDPTHVYETPGEFEVLLVVRDARGAVSAPKRDNIKARPAA